MAVTLAAPRVFRGFSPGLIPSLTGSIRAVRFSYVLLSPSVSARMLGVKTPAANSWSSALMKLLATHIPVALKPRARADGKPPGSSGA